MPEIIAIDSDFIRKNTSEVGAKVETEDLWKILTQTSKSVSDLVDISETGNNFFIYWRFRK